MPRTFRVIARYDSDPLFGDAPDIYWGTADETVELLDSIIGAVSRGSAISNLQSITVETYDLGVDAAMVAVVLSS